MLSDVFAVSSARLLEFEVELQRAPGKEGGRGEGDT